jgi:hypothetical protein
MNDQAKITDATLGAVDAPEDPLNIVIPRSTRVRDDRALACSSAGRCSPEPDPSKAQFLALTGMKDHVLSGDDINDRVRVWVRCHQTGHSGPGTAALHSFHPALRVSIKKRSPSLKSSPPFLWK